MKITFLGTGTSQGIPVIGCQCAVCRSNDLKDNRTRTSIFIDTGNEHIVIDVGPDFRQQMLREKILKLDGVLITHEHNDHVIGLDDIRPYYFQSGSEISFYMSKRVIFEIKQRFPYVFAANPYPGAPRINIMEIRPYQEFQLGSSQIIPLPVMHGQLEVLAFKLNRFLYITDASFIPDESLSYMTDIDIMVINALRHKPHYSHFTLNEALEKIEIIRPQTAYLTHISHLLGIHEKTSSQLPKNVFLAYDGLKIDVKN